MEEAADSKFLIDSILAGNTGNFKIFIERYQRLVSHIVFRLVTNKADREDVCQDVFLKAYQNLSGFEFKSRVSTWVARIAYNTCLNHLTKKKAELFDDLSAEENSMDSYSSASPSPHFLAEKRDLALRLHNEIEMLPMHHRTILTLYHMDEMSYAEIGEIMNLPEGTVKSYLFRARKSLKEKLLIKYQEEVL
jgi:RNA polymerase sigma factor (sigma-70 family)